MNPLLEDLKWRGLLFQCTDEPGLDQKLSAGPVTLYGGYDPSAESLQVGNLLSIVLLRRFQDSGHRLIVLVGGATGLIGDPKLQGERVLQPVEVVSGWAEKIKTQLSRFLKFDGTNAASLVNNYDWIKDRTVVEFLRDVGKHFSVTQMLHKESVKARLEVGISFTEFSYMILQAYDFQQLYRKSNCSLQVGGSDQWGNITAGCELIRKTEGAAVFGLTTPLVTDAEGKKLGKTESGTVWLDASKTTPYQFYQFWLNQPDAETIKLLKFFTFLNREEIGALETGLKEHPEKREAQRRLAAEVTAFVHGQEACGRAIAISEAFFSEGLARLSLKEFEEGFREVPSIALSKSPAPVFVDLLVQAGLSSSKRQAREDITARSVTLVGKGVVDDPAFVLDPAAAATSLHGKYTVLRKGKKNYRLIKWTE